MNEQINVNPSDFPIITCAAKDCESFEFIKISRAHHIPGIQVGSPVDVPAFGEMMVCTKCGKPFMETWTIRVKEKEESLIIM